MSKKLSPKASPTTGFFSDDVVDSPIPGYMKLLKEVQQAQGYDEQMALLSPENEPEVAELDPSWSPLMGHERAEISALSPEAMYALQTFSSEPPGYAVNAEYGNYWVLPDSEKAHYSAITQEQISESDYAELKSTWDKVQDGSGKLEIVETDSDGTEHAGFRDMIIAQIAILLSKPSGRFLITTLVNGSHGVRIEPSNQSQQGQARGGAGSLIGADDKPNRGASTTVVLSPDLDDDSLEVYDAKQKPISAPVFTILGHELVHAYHNELGINRNRQLAANFFVYTNREEEQTIATGDGVTENTIREEHGLPLRHGHGGTWKD